jgi:SWI/SNF-related matrix-associated actin-dependent regulator 1 of chromatin subfamily A
MPTLPNKFANFCNNKVCINGYTHKNKKKVPAQKGFIQKIDGKWVVWCKDCYPEKIEHGRRELTADGKLYCPYNIKQLALIKSLSRARWNGDDKNDKHWTVSLDMKDRRRLLEVADELKLKVDPKLRKIKDTAEAKRAKLDERLFNYQVDGVNWLSQRSHGLLGDEMGLGKTVQTLMAVPKGGRIIACVPAGIKKTWANEIGIWRPDLKPVILEGRNNLQMPKKGEVVLVGHNCLPDYLEQTIEKKEGKKKYISNVPEKITKQLANCYLIGDEVHKFKNYKTQRAKRYSHLSRLVKKSYHLTGSPMMNRPQDLFGVLCSCNLIRDTFGTMDRFASMWGARNGRYSREWPTEAPPIIGETLRRVMLRRDRNEVLPDLPPKVHQVVVCNEMGEELAAGLDRAYEEWLKAEREIYGEELEKPRGLPPFQAFSSIRADLAASRIPAMLEFVEECEEQEVPLVVFSAHKAPINELKNKEGWEIITGDVSASKRQDIIDRFQRGELKGVGCTIGAGGVGVTLTRASTVLFVDLDWVPANNSQAEDRLCRIGQLANKVLVVRMVSDHVLDRHILALLSEKMRMIESVEAKQEVEVEAGETDKEYEKRLQQLEEALEIAEALEKEAKKQEAKARTAEILGRQRQRAQRPELPLTPKRIDAVKKAHHYMLSICDGAKAKDDQGFNKPDAVVAHYMGYTGLETKDEVRTIERILSRYHRQLHKKYPILFEG